MIKIVCTILAIVIKDFEVHLSNLNLSSGKSAIYFESLAQKRKIVKQIASIRYY